MAGKLAEERERNQSYKSSVTSEEKFRRLYQLTTDAVILLDESGVFDCNEAALRLFGCQDRRQLIGKNLGDLAAPTQRNGEDPFEKASSLISRALTEGSCHLEWRLKRLDGTELLGDVLLTAIELEGKKVIHTVVRDITEKKVLEDQLHQARRMESIGQLAAGIAHEINTPTQYVGDNISFLKDAFADISKLLAEYRRLLEAAKAQNITPELVESVSQAEAQVDTEYLCQEVPQAINEAMEGIERISKIVLAMKQFAHPGSEEKVATDINKAIQSTITVSRNEWKYVAEMETDFDETIPLVPCLRGEFNQVILNLIVNAAHAIADVVGDGSKGKGKIRISTRRDGDWAEVRVSDTGTGIPEEIRSKVFDPFFTTKEVGKGTGQGLAIAHSVIVEKHNGTITFETEPSKGTTFIIRLPIRQDAESPAGPAK